MTSMRPFVLAVVAAVLWACESPPPPASQTPATSKSASAAEPAAATPAGPRPETREGAPIDAAATAAPGETFGKVERLPGEPNPHWVWVSDSALNAMPDGRAYLIDGDTGRYLGGLSTGYSFASLTLPRHYRAIYSAETYYSRYTRGQRQDVVSFYDPQTLEATGEVGLPAKRASTLPRLSNAAITDDDRFMAVFNITPATSLSIVDLEARKFVGEIDIPGCAMAYPSGPRTLFSLCTDGSLMSVEMDDKGRAASKTASAVFFDVNTDPILEHGVRAGAQWLFASVEGYVHAVDFSGGEPAFPQPWSLMTDADRAEHWRIGGWQYLALHRASKRLYVIVHQGEFDSYEEPGPEVWVYDLATKQRLERIRLSQPAISIELTQDDEPLLFAIAAEKPVLDVYDAGDGSHLRAVDELGHVIALLQTPWDERK